MRLEHIIDFHLLGQMYISDLDFTFSEQAPLSISLSRCMHAGIRLEDFYKCITPSILYHNYFFYVSVSKVIKSQVFHATKFSAEFDVVSMDGPLSSIPIFPFTYFNILDILNVICVSFPFSEDIVKWNL